MVTIENVSFSYQDAEGNGIQNINLSISPGECLLLCGKSGCGKTTVTRLLNGLIPHFHSGTLTGRVQVVGMDISKTPMHIIGEKVGSVFQNPRSQFFNVDTDSEIAFALENMAYPAEKIRQRVKETVQELGLEKLVGRSIFQLSGGEKQKIAFACIYALAPEVYVLDEPSSNLDVQGIEELGNLLKLLKSQGKTIVIAEHRLYYLKDIVDRILYMDKGSIRAEYTCGEFLQMSAEARAAKGLRTMECSASQVPNLPRGPRQPVLEIRNLTMSYGKRRIMENLHITASHGDIIGVIGNNGVGKSTFSKTLCGLRKEVSGLFLWKGRPVNPKQRLLLSYLVMQDVNYQLFADSVEEECYLGSDNPEQAKVGAVLRHLSLYEDRNRHPMSLSGGQKQRVAVAVSQLCNKEIIIFDEPTSGLDFASMMQVGEIITALAVAGKVIFIVSHDYELITKVCNRRIDFEKISIEEGEEIGSAKSKPSVPVA